MKKIEEKLLKTIGEERLNHSLRVMNVARELSRIYGEDEEKATLAGLLHDCARFSDKSYLLKKARDFDIILNDIYTKNANLLHAPLGEKVAKEEYDIEDIDILNAIKYHTTGREKMSKLEKIVYLADYIEPNRDFEGIEEIRDLCFKEKSLDLALVKSIDNTIIYILNNKQIIHEYTIKARNFLLFNMN